MSMNRAPGCSSDRLLLCRSLRHRGGGLLCGTILLLAAGTGHAGPGVNFGAAFSDFRNQLTGQRSGVQTIRITNSGDAPLTIFSVNLQGANAADFVIASDSAERTLATDASRTVGIQFRPLAVGSRVAYLAVSDNASGSPHVVTLVGNGVTTYVHRSPASLGFGQVWVGRTSTKTVTVRNDGNTDLHIGAVQLGGAGAGAYGVDASGLVGRGIAPGSSGAFSVTFRPGAALSYGAVVRVVDDAPYSPHLVSLAGEGVNRPPIPRSPTGLSVQTISSTRLNLSWTDTSSNETGFELHRRDFYGSYQRIALLPAGTTHYLDTNLRPLTTYIYHIRSYNDVGVSEYWSNEAVGSTVDPPVSPSGLTATAAPGRTITLRWQDNSTNETAFEVYREGSWRIAILPPNTTAFTDTQLTPNTPFTYWVRAVRNEGASANSNRATDTARF
jgi:hypothetical protein